MARRSERRNQRDARPRTPAEYERHATTRATVTICWVLLAAVAPAAALLGLFVPEIRDSTTLIAAGLALFAGVTLVIARRGNVAAAGIILVLGSWTVFTFVIWTHNGMDSPAVAAYFLIVILAALVQDWRWGIAAAALCTASVIVIAIAQTRGLLPPAPSLGTRESGLAFAAYLAAIGGLQALLAQSVSRARRSATQAFAEQRAAEKRLVDVVENAPFGALICELTRDGRLEISHVNSTATSVLGVDARAYEGRRIDEMLQTLQGSTILSTLKGIAQEGGGRSAESVPFSAKGREMMLELHAFQIGSHSLAVFFTDVTRRQREHVQVRHAAMHDHLTQLPNRKLFLDRLTLAIAAAHRKSTNVGMLFIDLDSFKPVNDTRGHATGDALLVAVADRLRQCARASDTIARFGGDEFAVLMPEVDHLEQLETLARKIIHVIAEPYELDGETLRITASIGVSMTSDEDCDANRLIEHADIALYRMKAEGRGGYRMFEPQLAAGELV